jgi:acetolactate synthase-1/2/3 large subunit
LKQADLVIVIGTPLDFRLRFGALGDAKVVHLVDAPDRLADHCPLAASAAGDLSSLLRSLAAAVEETVDPSWPARLREVETRMAVLIHRIGVAAGAQHQRDRGQQEGTLRAEKVRAMHRV